MSSMKKSLGAKTLVYPTPVLVVGRRNEGKQGLRMPLSGLVTVWRNPNPTAGCHERHNEFSLHSCLGGRHPGNGDRINGMEME